MDFMGQIRQKIAYIESPQCQNISFVDVWYMFKPGDEIVRQSRTQVYRVVSVTGHTHKVITHQRKLGLPEDVERVGIELLCTYISFDGEKLGPIFETIKIRPWDGDRPVASLPAFPLRYMANGLRDGNDADVGNAAQAVRDRLVARGKSYLNVATAAFKQMHYSGLTVEKDDVDSPVVVDFNEAFTKEAMPTAQRSILTNLLVMGQESVLGPKSTGLVCLCEFCKPDRVFDEDFAENKRTQEYLAGLMPGDSVEEPPLAICPRNPHSLENSAAAVSDSDLLIMDFKVPGFILRSRKWGRSKIPCLTNPFDIISLAGIY